MAKEYTHRHGRRKRKGAKKRRKSKKKKHARVAPGFRRRRRYASQPRRPPPASVLHERTTHAMMMELGQLLGPRFPGPNKITQQGPPFLPYDPWARQRNLIRHQDDQRLEQMRRIAEQEVRDARVEDAALEDEE